MKIRINRSLTIFTPTYNRAHLLGRLFDSIKAQVPENGPVEWLIVDDGSTDGTRELVAGFMEERSDLISYVRVANGGKHRAFNLAAKICAAPWIMSVDSDDLLVNEVLEDILDLTRSADLDPTMKIGVIRGLSSFPGRPGLARRFRSDSAVGKHAEWVDSTRHVFDTTVVFRREMLITYPFSDYEGEQFQAESLLWHRIDKTHNTMFVNRIWCQCYYQPDGLSSNSARLRAESPRNAMAVYASIYSSDVSLSKRIRAALNWWRYCFHARERHLDLKSLSELPNIYRPLGYALFLLDGNISRRVSIAAIEAVNK